jgi:hypothetical protein
MSAIFISHSSKDNADAMAAWLMKQGHTSYFINYDEKSGINPGANWEQVLYQRLRQCQAVVALVTPDWLESKWCFAEMIQARDRGKPIFPVIAKLCQLPELLSDKAFVLPSQHLFQPSFLISRDRRRSKT